MAEARGNNMIVRLKLLDGETVEQALKRLGIQGQAALQRIEKASKPASRGLNVINNASRELQGGMQGLAGRAGGLGGVLAGLGPVGIGVGAAFGAAAIGISEAMAAARVAMQELSSLGDAADKLGLTAEELQELRFAAEQMGIQTKTTDLAFQRFTRRLAEAQQGTGELTGVLKQYGIQVKNSDGSNRRSIDVFRDLADKIAGVSDRGEQLRIAFKAFDSEGAALVNLMRQGSKGLDDFRAKARAAGVVLSNELVEGTRSAGAESNKMDLQMQAQMNRLGSFFTKWSNNWDASKVRIITAINEVLDKWRDLDELSGDGLEQRFDENFSKFHRLEKDIAVTREMLKQWRDRGFEDDHPIVERLVKRLTFETKELEAAREAYKAAHERVMGEDKDSTKIEVKGGIDADGGAEAVAATRKIESTLARLKRAQADMGRTALEKATAANLNAAGFDPMKAITDDRAAQIVDLTRILHEQEMAEKRVDDAIKASIGAFDEANKQAAARGRALQKLQQDGEALTRSTLTQMERANQKLEDARKLKEAGTITDQTFARVQQETAKIALDAATDWESGVRQAMANIQDAQQTAAQASQEAVQGMFTGTKDFIKGIIKEGKVDLAGFADFAANVFAEIAAKKIATQAFTFASSFFFADGGAFESGRQVAPFAMGGAFDQGNVIPFARGTVVDQPTFFPMTDGRTGLMGEAGPEAIMPLTRTASGALGVRAEMPAMGMGAMALQINQNFVFNAAPGQAGQGEGNGGFSPEVMNQIGRLIDETTREAVITIMGQQMRAGGMLNPAGGLALGGG